MTIEDTQFWVTQIMSLKLVVEGRQFVFPYGCQVGYFHVTLKL